jgi:hypothetical protein
VDSVGSIRGPVTSCSGQDDEPSGYCATELFSASINAMKLELDLLM